jgi:tetratricopeptide (TPR) repeat protein
MRTALLLLSLGLPCLAVEPDIDSLIQNGHWKRARNAAEAQYKSQPDARSAYRMARVKRVFQSVDEAVKYAEESVRLDPKVAAFHLALYEAYRDQLPKVSFLKQPAHAHKMHAELDAALSLAPRDVDVLTDQVGYLLNAPGFAGGDKKKAIDVANEIVKIDPARGYTALLQIARSQKEDRKLEELYRRAVESDPKNYAARANLAAFYSEESHLNPGLMERHARAALDLNSDRIAAYRLLAFALASQKRFDETAKILAQAEAAVPDDLSPYVYAARAMLAVNAELPKAEGYLRKYLSTTKEAEAGSPSPAGAHWSLGLVCEKQGRLPEAKAELQTALRLKPDFEPAKRDLQRLK